MLTINPIKNGFIKKNNYLNILRDYSSISNNSNNNVSSNSFLDSLDWGAKPINKNKLNDDNNNSGNNSNNNNSNNNNNNNSNSYNSNDSSNKTPKKILYYKGKKQPAEFLKIQWSKESQKTKPQNTKTQQSQKLQKINDNKNNNNNNNNNNNFTTTENSNNKKYYNNLIKPYKEFSSSSIQIEEEKVISKRKLKEIERKNNQNSNNNNNNNNNQYKNIINKNKNNNNKDNKNNNLDSNINDDHSNANKFLTPMLDQIITCNERFRFILNPMKLQRYDVVLVYNRVKKRIFLEYISMIDIKNHKLILSEGDEYSIHDLILCFPLSPLRKYHESLFKELIDSLSGFTGIHQEHHKQFNIIKKKISLIKTTERKKDLFGLFDAQLRELLVLLNNCFLYYTNNQFESHSKFFNKYSFMSEVNTQQQQQQQDIVIDGLKVIGSIEDWSDEMKSLIRNEISISEGASLFNINTYHKSKWSDLLSYFYFVSSLEYFPFYQLSSPRNFSFRSKSNEIFNNIQMLNDINHSNNLNDLSIFSTNEIDRLKFFKYCLEFLKNNINNDTFKLNHYSKKILKNENIILNHLDNNTNQPPFPILYLELLKKYYNETQCIQRFSNYETKLIYSKLLEPIGLKNSNDIKLLLSYLLSKYKLSQETLKNDKTITFTNNPNIKIDLNKKDEINNRIIIGESYLLNQMDSSISLREVNQLDGSIMISINIPDITDSIPEKSSIDTWCMIKSLNYESSNGEICKMLPEDIYDQIKLNNNNNSNDNDKGTKCISITIKFNNSGEIIESSVEPSIVQNIKLLTNDNLINDIIKYENIDNDTPCTNDQKEEETAINNLINYIKIIKCQTKYSSLPLTSQNIKELIKELSNHAIGKFAFNNSIEIPYWNYIKEVQISNSTSKNIKLITCEPPTESDIIGKGSKYKNQNIFLTPNSNIVSPLTNYLDLFVLRIIKNYFINKQKQSEQQSEIINNNNNNNNSSLSLFTKEEIRNIIIPFLNYKYSEKKI